MKKVIVAPLNWGLGHASRCVPIIKSLIKNQFTPVIASDGNTLEFLKKEFPTLESFELPSYDISYGKNLKWRLFLKTGLIAKSIQKEYESLKDQVDVVFGLTHVKVEQDEEIARLLPNIPLIMGGHEHTKKDRTVGNVIIRKADANAKSAYIHTINFDKASKTTSVSSRLQMIDTTVTSNPAVKTIVDKWQKIMNEEISNVVENPYEIIYTTEVPLEARDTPIRSVQTLSLIHI